MSFTIHTQEPTHPVAPTPDEFKNDYQNALKRKLKIWAEWREDVNNVLAQGGTMEDAPPLESYLVQKDHPTENPKILLAYCASGDNITPLRKSTFLHYGIPRVKNTPSSPATPLSAGRETDPAFSWDHDPRPGNLSPPVQKDSPRVRLSSWEQTPKSPREWEATSPKFNRRSSQDRKTPAYRLLSFKETKNLPTSADDDRNVTDLRTGRVGKSHQTLPERLGNEGGAPRRRLYQSPEGAKSAITYTDDPPPDYEDKTEMYSEPAADYERSHDGLYHSHDLRRSHGHLQRSHDDLRRSHDDLQRSRDEKRRSHDSLNNAGRRYRGSLNVVDSYDYEYYQPK